MFDSSTIKFRSNIESYCLCLIALSSILQCKIMSIYPSTSTNYMVVFNVIVDPRVDIGRPMIHIMWSRSTPLTTVDGNQANHFAPVLRCVKATHGLLRNNISGFVYLNIWACGSFYAINFD